MICRLSCFTVLLLLLFFGSASVVDAQAPLSPAAGRDASTDTGVRPYVPYAGVQENINLTNGNLNLKVPLLTLPGRNGHDFTLELQYDSKIFKLDIGYDASSNSVGGAWMIERRSPNDRGVGWRFNIPYINGFSGVDAYYNTCIGSTTVILSDGSRSIFNNNPGCPAPDQVPVMDSEDTSGMQLDVSNPNDVIAILRDGTRIHFPSFSFCQASKIVYPDGNVITFSPVITDTLGRQITISYGSGNTTTITYKDSNGVLQTISLVYGGANLAYSFHFPVPCRSCPNPVIINGRSYTGPYSGFLTQVVLPNNRQFSFEYNNGYGELTKITYPSGGYTAYDYSISGSVPTHLHYDGVTSLNADFRELRQKRACGSPTGTCASEDLTTYTPTVVGYFPNNQSMDVVAYDGSGKSYLTRHQFTQGVAPGDPNESDHGLSPHETSISYYSDQSVLQRTVATTYDGNFAWSLPTAITTTLDNGLVKKEEFSYDTYSVKYMPFPNPDIPNQPVLQTVTRSLDNVTEHREFAFGNPQPGSLLRKTDNTWIHVNPINSQDYFSPAIRILSREASEQVFDGGGSKLAETQFEYDSFTEGLSASGAVQHDPNYGTNYTTRGELTAIKRWRNTDGAYLTTRLQYDDAGNARKLVDPLNHPTTTSYADAWGTLTGGNACAPSGGNAAAYATSVTNALNQATFLNYYSCSGALASSTDPNSQTTSFSYDLMGRRTQTNLPDGGQTATSYNDVPPVSATTTIKITSAMNLASTAVMDGFARVTQAILCEDGTTCSQTIKSLKTYDGLGRTSTVYNPTRCSPPTTNCGESTWGITTTNYDALNRAINLISPDGTATANNISTAYAGNCVTVTDQAGKIRKSCSDALGRLIQVFEPDSSNSLIYETDYQYDVLNNLLRVDQKGNDSNSANWRTRLFTYNSLSQLLTANNPESGALTYTYFDDGTLHTKLDARSITTTYAYDFVHRLTGKSYSNLDPAVSYTYDQAACLGQPACYNIGRRTSMTDAAGSEAWSYDKMGRVLTDQRTTNSITRSALYAYDLAGNVTSLTNPSGRVITYAFDAAARPIAAVDTANSINYATGALYSPAGALASLNNDASIASTYFYNNRLQPCRISVRFSGTAPASCTDAATGNVLDFSYNFSLGSSDNGNVTGITNNRDTTRSQSFTYDSLNRISVAETTSTFATSPSNCWGEAYFYDNLTTAGGGWGNLTTITSPSSAYTGCTGETLSVTALSNNQISGFCYDAAGNLLAQSAPPCPVPTYTYNAENQMTLTAGVTYTYDGDGRRVQKSSGKLYWYGVGSDPLDETDLTGSIANSTFNEYIFFNGKRIARRDSTNAVNYYFADHLGTARIVTNSSGTVLDDSDFYPFGGERLILSSSGNNYKFTGKERDSESGLDNFGARYNSSSMGRFMSPDPGNIGVNRANPQGWNAYTYSLNNPLVLTDPTGLYVCEDSEKCDSANDQAFAKSLAEARTAADAMDHNSQDYKDAIRAINAYGDQGDDNGVNVRFDSNVPGGTTEVSGVANGNKSADLNPNGQNINVTFNPNAVGKDFGGGLVAHEGSHVADGSAWVASGFSANMNPTHSQTELDAFHVQFNVYNALARLRVPAGGTYSAFLQFNTGRVSWNQGDTFKMITPDLQQKLKENYKNLDSPAFKKGWVLQP